MSLILVDGFEDLFAWVVGSGGWTIGAGRTANGVSTPSISASMSFTIPSAQESDTVTLGVAFKISAFSGTVDVVSLYSDAGVTFHQSVRLNANGSLTFTRGGNTLGTTGVGVIAAVNTWYYVELQTRMHDTLGTGTIRVNGVTVLGPLTGLDTKAAGTKTTTDTIRLGNGSGLTISFDDLYAMTGTGDSFLGDCLVETLYPNGNGNANAWVGSDGDSTNNYLLVAENPPSISDYTGGSTSGQQDMYAMGNPTLRAGLVLGVCHQAVVGTSTNLTTFKQVNRRLADTKVTQTLLPTLAAYHYCLVTDPETGAAWTYSNLDSLQSGVEVS